MFNVHFFSLSFFSFPFFAALMPATPPKVYTPHTKKCSYNSNSYQWDSDRSKEPSGSHHSTSHCSSCTSNYSHHSTSVPTDAPTSLRKCGFLQASLSSAPLPSGLQASRQPFQNSACQFCPEGRLNFVADPTGCMYDWNNWSKTSSSPALLKDSRIDLFFASNILVKCSASSALGLVGSTWFANVRATMTFFQMASSGLQASRQPFQNSACQFCPKRKDQLSCRSHRMYVWLGKYSCNDLFYASHTLVKCLASCALGLGIYERRKTSSCFYEKLVCVNVY